METLAERLDRFENDFKSFTNQEKIHAIEAILRQSGPMQLRFLSTKLPNLLQRDFLKFLPTELGHNILKYLDYKTIARCCLVSKDWNKVVSGYNLVWMETCYRLGVVSGKNETFDTNWKSKLKNGLRRLKRFRKYRYLGFTKHELVGHSRQVTALCYRDGFLASGSEDRTVRLWHIASGKCKYKIVCHSCSELKFDDVQVITASFDNTIIRWEWSTGNILTKYEGHVGAVFCVDYNTQLDLVVSGSYHCDVKIWQMSSGSCLASKQGHELSLHSILLAAVAKEYHTNLRQDHIAISVSRECIKVWSAKPSDEFCCLATLTASSKSCPVNHFKRMALCNGRDIVCSSDKGVCFWNLKTLQVTRLFQNQDYNLLAFGDILSLCWKRNNVHIVNNKTEKCVCEIPSGQDAYGRKFKDCCGDVGWLNDYSQHYENGPVYFTKYNSKIVFFQWSLEEDIISGETSYEEIVLRNV